MATSGVALTVTYMAFDTVNNVGKTGDNAQHTLRLVADGSKVTPAASPAEVDATNLPGLYSLALTAAENIGTDMTLSGKSATAGIILVPTKWQNGVQQVSLQGTASAGGASTITLTGGVATDDYYKRLAVAIVAGKGIGQTRRIVSYVGLTKVATVGEAWKTAPDDGSSVFVVWNLDAGILVGADGKALVSSDVQDLSSTLSVNAKAVGGTTQTARDLGFALPAAAPAAAGGLPTVDANNRVQGTQDGLLRVGVAAGGGASTITLDAGASAIDGFYQNQTIILMSGPGAPQDRIITSYVGNTKVATVGVPWATGALPTSSTGFIITSQRHGLIGADGAYLVSVGTGAGQVNAASGNVRAVDGSGNALATATGVAAIPTNPLLTSDTRLNALSEMVALTGTASAGGSNTITLAGGLQVDNIYMRAVVYIFSGLGAGQSRRINSYVGNTRIATVGQPWIVTPDSTSQFVVWTMDPGALAGSDGRVLVSADTQDLSASLSVNVGKVGGTTQTGRDLGNALPTAAPGAPEGVAIVGSQMDLVDAPNQTGLAAIATKVWSAVTRTLSAFGFNVTVGANNDKTGYSLATAPPTAGQIDTQLSTTHGAGAWTGGGSESGAQITLTVHRPSSTIAGAKVSLADGNGGVNIMYSAEDGTARFERADGSYSCSVECNGYVGSMNTVVVSGGVVTSPAGGVLTVTALPTPSQVPVIGKTGSSAFGTGNIPGVVGPDQCLVYVDFKQVAGGVPVGANDASLQVVEVVSRPAGTSEVFATQMGPVYSDVNGAVEIPIERGAVVLICAQWPNNKSSKVALTVPDAAEYDLGPDLQQ